MSGLPQKRVTVLCSKCNAVKVETAVNRAKFAVCRVCKAKAEHARYVRRYTVEVGYSPRVCRVCCEPFVRGLCGCKE